MNKTLVSVLVGSLALIVVIAGVLVYRMNVDRNTPAIPVPTPVVTVPTPVQNEPTPEAIMEKKEEVVVNFDGAKFIPASVSVKKGTPVKFVNTGTTTMWVASAVHPTHGVYPEFDQKTTGNEYTFVFDKVGNWKYHNHAPFVAGGTISVTE